MCVCEKTTDETSSLQKLGLADFAKIEFEIDCF